MIDRDFDTSIEQLKHAVDLMAANRNSLKPAFALAMPEIGLGGEAALELLAPYVLGGAAPLGSSHSFAHMDPPTPWVTWAATLWNASLNQNPRRLRSRAKLRSE
jgi:L-2,4-diaminobutyrate decarboxylase